MPAMDQNSQIVALLTAILAQLEIIAENTTPAE